MNTTDKEWLTKLESEGDDEYVIDHTLSNTGLRKYRAMKLQQIEEAKQTIAKIDAKLAARSDDQEAADNKDLRMIGYWIYPLYLETSTQDDEQ